MSQTTTGRSTRKYAQGAQQKSNKKTRNSSKKTRNSNSTRAIATQHAQ
jgi:hypothetical protein